MNELSWDRIKAAFEAALGASEDERAGVLDRLCAGDAALRREVESLLQARTRDLVRTGGAAAAVLAGSPTASVGFVAITEKAGSVIGPYRLLQPIGEGGFGTVFLAEQTAPVRRRVALKIIKLGMDTRQVVARFEAERQALALMDHPNIARVYDGGATDAGRPFFVMEYVVGDPITTFAAAKQLGVRDRLDLFMQVCRAVQHAHTKGIIHRDLKPANVLVSVVDGKPLAKVIDFGIAKATGALAGLGGVLTPKTLFTEHGQLIGTPEYMSPEQAEGSPDIDTRTDVYALGVLLYELLTGLTPFDARRLRSAGWVGMQKIIRDEEPAPPSVRLKRILQGPDRFIDNETEAQARVQPQPSLSHSPHTPATASAPRSLRTIVPDQVKGELDWIVMKALDKDRARRYETPGTLAADIARHLEGEAVQAAPPGRAYRVRKFVRRHRRGVIAGLVVAIALLAGIGSVTFMYARLRAQTERIDRIATLTDLFAGASMELVDEDASDTTLFNMLIGRFDAGELADAPVIELAFRAGLVQVLMQGEYSSEQFTEALDPAVDISERLYGPGHPRIVELLTDVGDYFYELESADTEEYESADRYYAFAVDQLRRGRPASDDLVKAIANLAWSRIDVALDTGGIAQAQSLLKEACAVAGVPGRPPSKGVGELLASFEHHFGKLAERCEVLETASELLDRLRVAPTNAAYKAWLNAVTAEGIMWFRAKHPRRALDRLSIADEGRRLLTDAPTSRPVEAAYLAMSHHLLGDADRASAELKRAAQLAAEEPHRSNSSITQLVEEARTLIGRSAEAAPVEATPSPATP